jgi:MFS family permease
MQDKAARAAFATISGQEKPAEDLDGKAARAEARNGLRHVTSLSMTKVADGLIDPKLVLAWLMTALGAPAVFAGALVPIREAGSLLPQVPLAALLQRVARRKWIWVWGSVGQGAAAAAIALSSVTLQGMAAGFAICAALAMLALSRAACSVSYKDILGRTVGKSRRGSVTGLAGSVASVGVLVFAGLLMSGLLEQRLIVTAALVLAAALWALAALLFSTLEETPAETGKDTAAQFRVLRESRPLRQFILARGLLVSTALAPPYLVVLSAGAGEDTLGRLGALVLASALASLASSYVWGRLADVSSRRVLMLTGFVGALAMAAAVVLWWLGLAATAWAMPVVLFVLMVAYHGVRQGRSIYLVDLAPEDLRAAYAAVANTVIGVLLLIAGVIGGGAALVGPQATLALFAVMALAAVAAAARLPEVEQRD